MKKHLYIFILTVAIIIIDCFIFFYANNNGLFIDKATMISSLFMMILAVFFPMSFYTCFQLICDDNKKGHFLARLIEGFQDGFLGGVFIVPFLLAPLFIYDYVIYFMDDVKKSKKEKTNNFE